MQRLNKLVLVFLILATAVSARASVKFKQNEFTIPARAGVALNFDLRELLVDKNEKLHWSFNQTPTWVGFSFEGERALLTGTPSLADVGKVSFRLFAADEEESGATCIITLDVKDGGWWKSDKIDLGVQEAGSLFTFDLKHYVYNSTGSPLKFVAKDLPGWMTLRDHGILSGTPASADAGSYGPIELTVSEHGKVSTAKAFGVVLKSAEKSVFKAESFEFTADLGWSVWISSDSLVREPIPESCKWYKQGLPDWLRLVQSVENQEVVLMGVPPLSAANQSFEFTLGVRCGDSAESTKVKLNVGKVGSKPLQYSVFEGDVLRRQLFSPLELQDSPASGYTFSLVEESDWVSLLSNGELEARPKSQHVGKWNFTFRVKTPEGVSWTGSLRIWVQKKNIPAPAFKTKGLKMPEGYSGVAWLQDLSSFVNNPSGGALQFAAKGNPAWLKVGTNGVMAGTPGVSDTGNVSFVVEVTGAGGKDLATVEFSIVKIGSPPTWSKATNFVARVNESFVVDLSGYVSNPDGGALRFSIQEATRWLSLTPAGILRGTPGKADVGKGLIAVTVANAFGNSVGIIELDVQPAVPKVGWAVSPLSFQAVEKSGFSVNLFNYVINPEAEMISFSMVNGPSWGTVTANGTFAGTPDTANIGENRFRVRVTGASGKSAEADLVILVLGQNQPPYWIQNPIDLGTTAADVSFAADLSSFVKVNGQDPVRFAKVSGPAWLAVGSQGKLVGIPGMADIGDNRFSIQACNPKGCSPTLVILKIAPSYDERQRFVNH